MKFLSSRLSQSVFGVIDVGTRKICCALAQLQKRHSDDPETSLPDFKLLGVGHHVSRGLKMGRLIDMEALQDSILHALQAAEQAAERRISEVYVSLSGSLARSHFIEAEIPLNNHTVSDTHIRKLMTLDREKFHAQGEFLVHVFPLGYRLGHEGIRDPRGMAGDFLATTLHVVTVPLHVVRNLLHVMSACQLDVKGWVLAPYASALATWVDDEWDLGATLIEIGAEQTTVSSYMNQHLLMLKTIPLGGDHITRDIARGLSTPLVHAERLKTLYGTVLPSEFDTQENIFVVPMGEAPSPMSSSHVTKAMLTRMMRARVEEILEHARAQLTPHCSMDSVVFQRFILTGGGAMIQGIRDMAPNFLGAPVRIGTPRISKEGLQTPSFSTLVGLLIYVSQAASGQHMNRLLEGENPPMWRRLQRWWKENL